MKNRFKLDWNNNIVDMMDGIRHNPRTREGMSSIVRRMNDINNRNHEVEKILKKYEIDSLEKLDKILFEQKVW